MTILSRYRTVLLLLSISFLSACSNKPQSNSANTQPLQAANPTANATTPPADVPRVDRPLLFGLIRNVSIYPVPGQSGNSAVSLVISVSNSGVSTYASEWKLEVSSAKRSFSSEPVHVNGVVEMPGSASKTVDLSKEDLDVKARENPIVPGKPLEGILTFVLPQTSEKELTEAKASLVLQFKDKPGNSYQTTRVVIGDKTRK